MCRSKPRYPTENAAISVVIRRQQRGSGGRVYRCPVCGGFHVADSAFRERRGT